MKILKIPSEFLFHRVNFPFNFLLPYSINFLPNFPLPHTILPLTLPNQFGMFRQENISSFLKNSKQKYEEKNNKNNYWPNTAKDSSLNRRQRYYGAGMESRRPNLFQKRPQAIL
jgi:hypothetical protein